MARRYLQVTYRKGKPLAAYLQLRRRPGSKAARSVPVDGGLIIDYDADGEPIGLEITSPASITTLQLDTVLRELGLPPLGTGELAPLAA